MWTLCERAQDCWYLKQKAGGRTWNNSYSEQSMEILWFSDEKGPLEASWVIPYASRSHQTLHNPMMPQTTRNLTHSIMPQTTPNLKQSHEATDHSLTHSIMPQTTPNPTHSIMPQTTPNLKQSHEATDHTLTHSIMPQTTPNLTQSHEATDHTKPYTLHHVTNQTLTHSIMPQTTPNCTRPPYPIPKTLLEKRFLCPGQRRTKSALGFWEETKLMTKKRNRMRKVLCYKKRRSLENRKNLSKSQPLSPSDHVEMAGKRLSLQSSPLLSWRVKLE